MPAVGGASSQSDTGVPQARGSIAICRDGSCLGGEAKTDRRDDDQAAACTGCDMPLTLGTGRCCTTAAVCGKQAIRCNIVHLRK